MTKVEFLALYGRHVYEVRLSAATSLLAKYGPTDALAVADQFIDTLLGEPLNVALDVEPRTPKHEAR
jgi:hypothetical protein